METGSVFVKDGKRFNIPQKSVQAEMAAKSAMNFQGKKINWVLTDNFGLPVPTDELYVPHYGKNCDKCGSKLICNGCCDCGKCN